MSELIQTPELEAPHPVSPLTMQSAISIGNPYPPRGGDAPPESWMAMLHTLAFNFPPFGAPPCTGQLMPLAQYTALCVQLHAGSARSAHAVPQDAPSNAAFAAASPSSSGLTMLYSSSVLGSRQSSWPAKRDAFSAAIHLKIVSPSGPWQSSARQGPLAPQSASTRHWLPPLAQPPDHG